MHGAGNDYIYVNCFEETVPDDIPSLARAISHRRFGVGGDGLVLICPSEVADARMRMFNADGSEAEMCGNAIRCVAKYVYDHGISRSENLKIETGAGVLELELFIADGKVDRVRVDMGEPILVPALVPTTLDATRDGVVIDAPLDIDRYTFNITCISMGNPHCVTFIDDTTDFCELNDDLVLGLGPNFETHNVFPNRINAEFVQVLSPSELNMRVWERGSGETWACGTGACAVCVAGVLTGRSDRKVLIHLKGGDLEIHWDESTNHIYKTGPATEVFSGEWEI